MGLRIQKEKVAVVVMTERFRIEGEIFLVAGSRLMDEMNRERGFVPLTNVKVTDLNKTNASDKIDFIALNKESIVFISYADPNDAAGDLA